MRHPTATTPSYEDYVKRKKEEGKEPLSKDKWEARVLQTGVHGDKYEVSKATSKVFPHLSPEAVHKNLDEHIGVIKRRLKDWDHIKNFVDGSREDHEAALKSLEEVKSHGKPKAQSPAEVEKIRLETHEGNLKNITKEVRELAKDYPDLADSPEYEAFEKAFMEASDLHSARMEPKTHEQREKDLAAVQTKMQAIRKKFKKKPKKEGSLRSRTLRFASTLPKGDGLRRALLDLLAS